MPKRGATRARLSLTSLIDVIFLLLLFFMLSSTFSKFGEIPLRTSSGNARTDFNDAPIVFARLTARGVTINGRAVALDRLETAVAPMRRAGDLRVLLSVAEAAQAQGLADALRAFQSLPDARFAILE